MTYAICFDWPAREGDPMFAGMTKDGLGWSPTLAGALLFDDEEEAARTLENGYGEGTRPYGVVVEVAEE